MNGRIYIVGFMGAGKTTLGKKLARKLGFDFYDTDRMLEAKYKVSIDNFFNKYGEDLFRKLEHQCLKETFHFDNCIVSTGGGLPCYFDSMKKINNVGISIYIELNDKAIFHRLMNSKQKRPLLNGKTDDELMDFISKKLEERAPHYKQASITISDIDVSVDDIIEKIKT